MTEFDEQLREQFDEITGPVPPPDWDAVMAQCRTPRRVTSPRVLVLLALAVGALLVATPLGAEIVGGIGGFSAWLTGQPGTPASTSAQHAFAKANARSWVRFPAGTQLRQLETVTAAGSSIDLLGFRSGDSLCLGVLVSGTVSGSTQVCAPLATLHDASAPVQVALVDQPFGKGRKQAWYGLNHFTAPALQVTAGIAADNVKSVTLHDQSGTHTVPVQADAFVYVAAAPAVGQRISTISAETASGTAPVAVPFAPALLGFSYAAGQPSSGKPTGPTRVQQHVTGGSIGWLTRRQPVGQPLTTLSPSVRGLIERHAAYGRVITPDPELRFRVAITLNTSPRGTNPIGVCTWQTGPDGTGGGCQRIKGLFSSAPITSGLGGGGGGQYSTITGLASDQVARITAYLSNGQTLPVALNDNVYLAELPRAALPARIVAYNAHGQIIGLLTTHTFQGLPSAPAQGRATLIKSIGSPKGRYVALYIGPSTSGGTCTYIKWRESKNQGGVSEGCGGAAAANTPTRLLLSSMSMGDPVFNLAGRAPQGTTALLLRYADGTITTIRPVRGYLVYLIPAAHLQAGHQLTSIAAITARGKTLTSRSFPRHPR